MKRMRTALVILLAAGLFAGGCVKRPGELRNTGFAGDLKDYRGFSWGKAGVTFAQYDETAFACTAHGMLQPGDTATRAMVQNFTPTATADAAINEVYSLSDVVDLQEAQKRADQRDRQAIVNACLAANGYRRFGLTDAQLEVLNTLPRGAPERRQYLHSLGSDPKILREQLLPQQR
jgi:hypothetical protein